MTAAPSELTNSAAAPALLGPQTVGILLRNILRTYRRHFGVLMACSLLPLLPFIVLLKWLTATEILTEIEKLWVLGVLLLPYMVAIFVAGGAMTVAVSDICLGSRPTVARAYGYILRQRRWWRMLSTGFLLAVMMLAGFALLLLPGLWVAVRGFPTGFLLGVMVSAGFLLFLLPGLWVMVRGFLSSVVVVLEGRKNMDAIKRSFALTKGQAWRIIGLFLLALLLAYAALALCIIVVVIVGVLTLRDPVARDLLTGIATDVLSQVLIAPVAGITVVLLYYDQRVRREAYDVQALAEDLMR
jgi:hypothetical protein